MEIAEANGIIPRSAGNVSTALYQTARQKTETGRYDSKIAGDPYFPKHEPYPEDESGRPMKLLAQINFADMPGLPDFPDT